MADQASIPLVDLNAPSADVLLLDAASKHGFVFVQHQDLVLTPDHVARVFALSKDFFASPTNVKEQFSINSSSSGKNQGWLGAGTEILDPTRKADFKEAFNVGEFRNGKAQQPLPEPLKSSEHELGRFFGDCHAVCNQILRLIASALDIPVAAGGEGWFQERHDSEKGASGSVLRLLYYPMSGALVPSDSDEDVRAGAHSDYGSITLLFRLPGQPGLEILTPSGQWAAVPVDPHPASTSGVLPILVNIGDLLSYWTSGLLKSTVHRVVFPKQGGFGSSDRYSIAYFCHPQDEAALIPIPSNKIKALASFPPDSARGGNIMTARDHLNSRLAATYKLK